MGCCLSTSDRGNAQGSINHTTGGRIEGNRMPSPNNHSTHAQHDERHRHRRPSHYRQSPDSHQEDGLPLEERVTRPLVRHTWTSRHTMTRETLMRRREEYYDTRVTGRPEIWAALRSAIETMDTDLATAQEIINASGITIPTGNLVNGAYDESGTRYELPDYCVSEPRNLITGSPEIKQESISHGLPSEVENIEDSDAERRREEKGKKVLHANEKQYTVVARLSDRGGPEADVSVKFTSSETVRSIARKVLEKGKLQSSEHKIRIIYLGKVLRESQSLNDQGWKQGNVVNAMVLQRQLSS